uniref:Uncharacterized protein n=1 Tax=Timema bartmani TaxID=61472 RepID=A0A7R9I2S3_9NEOP|nr:unnamed protein product [Timema bartmani]
MYSHSGYHVNKRGCVCIEELVRFMVVEMSVFKWNNPIRRPTVQGSEHSPFWIYNGHKALFQEIQGSHKLFYRDTLVTQGVLQEIQGSHRLFYKRYSNTGLHRLCYRRYNGHTGCVTCDTGVTQIVLQEIQGDTCVTHAVLEEIQGSRMLRYRNKKNSQAVLQEIQVSHRLCYRRYKGHTGYVTGDTRVTQDMLQEIQGSHMLCYGG